MNLVFCCEAVFQRYKGKYYTTSDSFGQNLWDRYLASFDTINIVARVEDVDAPTDFPLDNPRLSFTALPRYKGIRGTLQATNLIKSVLKGKARKGNAYILRVPGHIGSVFGDVLRHKNIPYAVEVVGDPWDVMENIGGKLSFILKRVGKHTLQKIVRNSSAALYVTQHQLQKRYTTRETARGFAVSDVKLNADFYASNPKRYPDSKSTWRLVAVGSLEQMYKAPDILIEALSVLKSQGVKVHVDWLGGGKFQKDMEDLASSLNVSDMIQFKGNVGHETVANYLDNSDIFVHISRTEGLPRAVIEAMAKGLPVVGTTVGGIPELIPPQSLVKPNDSTATAALIKKYIEDQQFYNSQALINHTESLKYEDSILSQIRNDFYNEVIRISQL